MKLRMRRIRLKRRSRSVLPRRGRRRSTRLPRTTISPSRKQRLNSQSARRGGKERKLKSFRKRLMPRQRKRGLPLRLRSLERRRSEDSTRKEKGSTKRL